MTLRRYYDERIDQIRSEIVRMGNLANEMIELAVEAAHTGNAELANEVIERDDQIDYIEEEVIRNTVLTVMQEAPVANDLRMLTSTLGVIGEIEKVADDAVKLARRSGLIGERFPGEMRAALVDIGVNARKAVASSIRLYTAYSSDLATSIISFDEEIDAQYSVACQRVVGLIEENPSETERYLKTIEIFHALEHIADRAVAIAKRLRVHYETGSVSRGS